MQSESALVSITQSVLGLASELKSTRTSGATPRSVLVKVSQHFRHYPSANWLRYSLDGVQGLLATHAVTVGDDAGFSPGNKSRVMWCINIH